MSYHGLSASSLQSNERMGQGTISLESQLVPQSLHATSIHILDDDSLLNIFHLYRPFILGEDQDINTRMEGEKNGFGNGGGIDLPTFVKDGGTSYLAHMLVHSPPLPLIIDYYRHHDVNGEDEEAITLALAQRDRVRRIRFSLPVLKLQKFTMAIDGEYPILEYLILGDPPKDKGTSRTSLTALFLPETLQTPHLRHLALDGYISIRPPLHGTTWGLVTLYLGLYDPSTYFHPAALLQWLSLMPQMEDLLIYFHFSVPNRDVERQLMRTPIMTHVTLPNLRSLALQAVSTYSEAVLSQITAPHLEDFQICYLKQLTFSVPQLLQFMGEQKPQVSSVVLIFNAPSQIFTTVEHLTLEHYVHSRSSEEHNEVDRIEWRKLLGSFSNVKTLRVHRGLVGELSRCLRLDDGEHPLELLPELQELTYSGTNDAFTSFIDARKNAGRPVTLIKY
ncbi:hypothetical protein BGY98DRAFT_1179792 [Russula aff. rugulosa BPL654]|nr:hypothetical protein BGY98DRAFT_1179792 [Russula aff. rugulosa BPL654]